MAHARDVPRALRPHGPLRALLALADAVRSALLWIVVVVPGAFGFWLVAGDMAGVPVSEQRALVAGSMLALGFATLLQVLHGCRLPIFEGPASTYLAAVAVVAVSATPDPATVTGGLLVAGAFVFVLGLLRVDRLLERMFTPVVATVFLLIVCIMVLPATLERAIGASGGPRFGTGSAWATLAVVLAVGLSGRAWPAMRPYSLLAALLAGTTCFIVLDGAPPVHLGGGLSLPELFPWGAPEVTFTVAATFALAGLLASFNTVASVRVMEASISAPPREHATRHGLLAHGVTQAAGACVGNVLGNVPRLDSAALVELLGDPRRRALALAAAATILLAFWSPFVGLVAALPVAVSAAVLALLLGMLVASGLRTVRAWPVRTRWLVVAPAVAPTLLWIPLAGSLGETAQLFANPLLWGVVAAIALERITKTEMTQ
jgi:xanthine/uracil permease